MVDVGYSSAAKLKKCEWTSGGDASTIGPKITKCVASLNSCVDIVSFAIPKWSSNTVVLSPTSRYLFVSQWSASGSRVIRRCHVALLREKLAFYACQGAALVERRAHKSPVAVHLHQLEYLTQSGGQQHTLSLEVKRASVHSRAHRPALELCWTCRGWVLPGPSPPSSPCHRCWQGRGHPHTGTHCRWSELLLSADHTAAAVFDLLLIIPHKCLVATLSTSGARFRPDFNYEAHFYFDDISWSWRIETFQQSRTDLCRDGPSHLIHRGSRDLLELLTSLPE